MTNNLDHSITELKTHGFCIVENVLTKEECGVLSEALDKIEKQLIDHNNIASIRSNTLLQLLNIHYTEPEIFMNYIDNKVVMDMMGRVFNDDFCLSNFNASRPIINSGIQNRSTRIHIDARQPCSSFENTSQVVAMWCIDDFTKENGATLIVPFSHHSGLNPRDWNNSDKYAVPIEASAGSIIFILGQTWHDIGLMIKDQSGGIIAYYSNGG